MEFFLRGVEETSVQAADTARAILALKQAHERLLEKQLGRRSGSGRKLLEHLFRRPVISVGDAAEVLGSSFPPANSLVGSFAKLGLLTELTGQRRNRFFRYQPYVDLLQRDRAPPLAREGTASPVRPATRG